jgi:acetyl esterase/lipase
MSHLKNAIRRRWSIVIVGIVGLSSTFVASSTGAEPADEIRCLKDLPYKTNAETQYERDRCKLDLYLPAKGEEFATVVWFHGGNIQAGDKAGDIAVVFARRFAGEGIAVASVNYRLHPKVHYPAYIEDAAAAFAFVRREIVKHGGSADRVFISGHSAGGYLTAMVGMDGRYLSAHGLKPADVAGLMPVAGQMITHSTVREERGIPKTQPVIDEAAPAYHARADAPPLLNMVGSQDLPARAEENRYFVAAMKAAGHQDVTYLEVEGRNHGTVASRVGDPDDVVAKAMISFIERLRP